MLRSDVRKSILWQFYGGFVALVVMLAALGELVWWSAFLYDHSSVSPEWTWPVHAAAALAAILLVHYRLTRSSRNRAFARAGGAATLEGRSFRFFLGPYPIKVEYSFFILAALYGFMTGSLVRAFFFIVSAFLAVIAHELGHAYAARRRSQFTSIELNLTGGLTTYFGPRLKKRDEIVIAFSGPLAGLVIGVVAYAISRAIPSLDEHERIAGIVRDFVFVNAGWGAMNLLPVLPLDGGRILAPMVRPRTIVLVSITVGFAIAIVAFLVDQIAIALLFGSLAAANVPGLRSTE